MAQAAASDDDTGAVGRTRGPTWNRLEDQLGWYDRKSISCQRAFKRLKVLQLVAAAAIPVAATLDAAAWITGGLGALVVVVEGIQRRPRARRGADDRMTPLTPLTRDVSLVRHITLRAPQPL
ncbi:MAG: DUF4231 domain-containing protein [Actinobacteria bacterium]|nr:DUF4231 domain-containing protein [Actinomycetota bacterium]